MARDRDEDVGIRRRKKFTPDWDRVTVYCPTCSREQAVSEFKGVIGYLSLIEECPGCRQQFTFAISVTPYTPEQLWHHRHSR